MIVFALDSQAGPRLNPQFFAEGGRNHDLSFGAYDGKNCVHRAYIIHEVVLIYGSFTPAERTHDPIVIALSSACVGAVPPPDQRSKAPIWTRCTQESSSEDRACGGSEVGVCGASRTFWRG